MSPTSSGALEGEHEALHTDIGAAVASGARWKIITQVVNEGARVVMVITLARLLSPAELGIAGMALVASALVEVFADPALAISIVQRPRITERDRSTVFWTTLGFGLTVTMLCVGLSGLVAAFFGEPQVAALFAVLAVSFTFAALGSTHKALLLRTLDFRAIQKREIGAALVGFSAAIAVAAAGGGAWAVIANTTVAAATSTLLLWVLMPWRPRLMFSRASLRDLGTFGGSVFLARIFQWSNLNADNMLVGRFLGASALGAYALAYNLMFLPMTRLANPLQKVLSPAFARLQHDPARLEKAFLRSKRVVVSLLAPGFMGLLVIAPDLVPVAFGSKWESAVVPMQLLCLAGLAHALVALHWSILESQGRGATLLKLFAFISVVTVSAFVIGLKWGIVGVAASYAVAKWALFLPDTWVATRGISFRFWSAVRASLSPVPVAACAAGVAFAVREAGIELGVGALPRLLVTGATMAVVYLGVVALVTPDLLVEVRDALLRGTRQSQHPAEQREDRVISGARAQEETA